MLHIVHSRRRQCGIVRQKSGTQISTQGGKKSSKDSPVHAVPNIVKAHKQIKAGIAELLDWMEEELEPRNRNDSGRVPFWSTHWKIEDYIHALCKQADLIETWVCALKDLKNIQAETVLENLPKLEL